MATDTPSMTQQISDVLDSQNSTIFSELSRQDLKQMLDHIDSQINWCREEKDRLASQFGDLSASIPSNGTIEVPSMATPELVAEKNRVDELYQRLIAQVSDNQQILDEVLKARVAVTEHMGKLFKELDEAQQGAQAEIATLEKSLAESKVSRKTNPGMDEAQKKLNKIKHDRCIFFGCIDVHPPDLFEL